MGAGSKSGWFAPGEQSKPWQDNRTKHSCYDNSPQQHAREVFADEQQSDAVLTFGTRIGHGPRPAQKDRNYGGRLLSQLFGLKFISIFILMHRPRWNLLCNVVRSMAYQFRTRLSEKMADITIAMSSSTLATTDLGQFVAAGDVCGSLWPDGRLAVKTFLLPCPEEVCFGRPDANHHAGRNRMRQSWTYINALRYAATRPSDFTLVMEDDIEICSRAADILRRSMGEGSLRSWPQFSVGLPVFIGGFGASLIGIRQTRFWQLLRFCRVVSVIAISTFW